MATPRATSIESTRGVVREDGADVVGLYWPGLKPPLTATVSMAQKIAQTVHPRYPSAANGAGAAASGQTRFV
jgi:hypothetical protein